jgi:choline kinase
MTNYRAIILAAGRGSRLGELTENMPKTLLPIGNSNCFESQIQIYKSLDFSEISVVTGYSGESFLRYKDINKIQNSNWANSNMLTSLLVGHADDKFEANIVSYGDIIFEQSAVKKIMDSPHEITILYDVNFLSYWNSRTSDPIQDLEDFQISTEGRILKIGTKPKLLNQIEGQYMGILKISVMGWQLISQFMDSEKIQIQNNLSITEFLSLFISKGMPVYGVPYDGKWSEIDTQDDLNLARKIFSI